MTFITRIQPVFLFIYLFIFLFIHFMHISVSISIPISQFIPPLPPPPTTFPPLLSIHLISASVSQFLPCKPVHLYHFSRFHILNLFSFILILYMLLGCCFFCKLFVNFNGKNYKNFTNRKCKTQ